MSLLQCSNIGKSFPGVRALDQVNLELNAGEVLALCGENGAGKSTFIKIISGIYKHSSFDGSLSINGEQQDFKHISDAEAAGINVIYQELALIPRLSVAENIFLGHEPTQHGLIDWEQLYGDAQALMARYDIDIDVSLPVMQLGIGQQQLVEIVKALSRDSKILLLDEPSAALTEEEVGRLLNIVRTLKNNNVACIYISHKLDEVLAIADRIAVLRDGCLVHTADAKDLNQNDIIRHMVGRDITDFYPSRSNDVGDEMLSLQHLEVLDPHSSQTKLHDINFSVHAGEVLGIGGLMGAGRSELLLHIMGAYGQRIKGEITLHQQPYKAINPHQAIEAGIMLVSEDRKGLGLIIQHSVNFNLSLSSLGHYSRWGFIDQEREHQANHASIKQLAIKCPGLESLVNNLSGGNQQKVVLGKMLMSDPQVVLLDEPTRGIDVGAKTEIYAIINNLCEQGKAVIMVSSELPELMGLSDRIIMLNDGHCSAEFTRQQFNQEDLLAAAIKSTATVGATHE